MTGVRNVVTPSGAQLLGEGEPQQRPLLGLGSRLPFRPEIEAMHEREQGFHLRVSREERGFVVREIGLK